MPYPSKGDTKQEYIEKFMKSPEARKDYPSQDQRAAVAYSIWKEKHGEQADTGKGRSIQTPQQ
jgi:hypothetical protein